MCTVFLSQEDPEMPGTLLGCKTHVQRKKKYKILMSE